VAPTKDKTKKTAPKKKAKPKTKPKVKASENKVLDLDIEILDPKQKLTLRKRTMIDALESTFGIVTKACEIAKITRAAHYKWLQEDPDYKAAYDDVREMQLDMCEGELFRKIQEGSTPEILFYLKCRGKKRGYVEKQEQEIKVVYDSKRDDIAVDPDDWGLE